MSARVNPVPSDTSERQRRASAPAASAWVSANAGSGKTWVLSRRVIRLLLAGTAPSKILCLTFTKAAAATMSNRVFVELGRWAVLPDAALAAEIAALEGAAPSAQGLAKARKLFAEAIETPGGLKIQTIHAFCEAILHQFPIEANLAGSFEVLDEMTARERIAEARDRVLVDASTAAPNSAAGRALALVLAEAGETGFIDALDRVVAGRDAIRRWIRDADELPRAFDDLGAALGVQQGDSVASIRAQMQIPDDFDRALLQPLTDALLASGANDVKAGERLEQALTATDVDARVEAWRAFLLTAAGEPRKTVVTKKLADRFSRVVDQLPAAAQRLVDLDDRLAALATAEATAALLTLGDAVIGHYEAGKRASGALDFEDLIVRTADLISRSDAAAWVQFKLDRGIDHILVDEAQDTSPRQWQVVRQLAGEFFSGQSARSLTRTLFAVGDEKQSIYSFQGAAPAEFAANRRLFAAKARDAGAAFYDAKLYLSFRSTPDVLAAVDTVFGSDDARQGLVSDPGDYQPHAAWRAHDPGRVEIWPVVADVNDPPPEDWTAPVDRLGAKAPAQQIAERIGREIQALLAPGQRLEGMDRPLQAKDILILVRKRGAFVDAMNRVLKESKIAVAGADRLSLTQHIAIEDLLALGRVMLLPEDDLSLAAVLKSPLIGWDDRPLMDVGLGRDPRRETLWAALGRHAGSHAEARIAYARLAAWRGRVDQAPPFEFYSRILSADGGRARFVARLGAEADDVLDEFLAHALAHERAAVPTLAGFLHALETAPPVIKREMDEARDEVRVMTVHGAKGLEAPVVFLVDSGAAPAHASHDAALVALPIPGRPEDAAEALVWVRPKAGRPDSVEAAIGRLRLAAAEEYRRLLYVAMTRAADRLYVCGYAGTRGPDENCWHQVIERALAPGAEPVLDAAGEIIAWRWRAKTQPAVAERAARAGEALAATPLPDWIDRPAPIEAAAKRTTPSAALAELDAKDGLAPVPARDALAAARAPDNPHLVRGKLTHALLERLPALDAGLRRATAASYLGFAGQALDPAARAELIDEVLAILDAPAFAAAFAAGSRAEVPIVGMIPTRDGGRLSVAGQIDRLAVTADEVLVIDYKTNRDPGPGAAAVPETYVIQMALYRRLLADIFPGRRILTAILWTAVPSLIRIEPYMLDAAADRLAIS